MPVPMLLIRINVTNKRVLIMPGIMPVTIIMGIIPCMNERVRLLLKERSEAVLHSRARKFIASIYSIGGEITRRRPK